MLKNLNSCFHKVYVMNKQLLVAIFYFIVLKCQVECIRHHVIHHRKHLSAFNNQEPIKPKKNIPIILPGTKWCGKGDIATSYDDLGKQRDTDICCREHDLCPDDILAGKSAHGLNNTGQYTRSHCDCDQKFNECLKSTKKITANLVGDAYFNILSPKCFKNDYPIISCETRKKLKKCVKYNQDTNAPKMYQWFDTPTF